MKTMTYFGVIGLLLLSVSCKDNQKTEDHNLDEKTDTIHNTEMNTMKTAQQGKEIVVTLSPKSQSGVSGTITFKEANGKVQMTADVKGLTPGEHAIHIHEKGDCSSDDASSTGGHWNPTNQPHGKWGAETGYHLGDIGNLVADENGNATLSFSTDEWCLDCEDTNMSLLNRGLIIHEGVDDFTTQPTGDAGKRVACGVIQ